VAHGLPVAAIRAELDPVELVWSNLKQSLANLTTQNIGQPTVLVKTRLRQMRTGLASSTVSSPRPFSTSVTPTNKDR
jgi:hypothetical protein